MSRRRQTSTTGFYHVILIGNNHQRIFEDHEDYRKFLYVLSDCQDICEFTLLAYCLMSNHIHLLIKPGIKGLDKVFMHFSARFVRWYNAKYQRTGHLFQGRYSSKPVNNIPYLLTVMRYIHQNPVRAGICKEPQQYKYSSYQNYFNNYMIDYEFTLTLISRDEFMGFHLLPNNDENSDECMDIDESPRPSLTDQQAIDVMFRISGRKTVSGFQTLDPEIRDEALRKMLRSGVRMRQACRITGTSYGVVRKCR